MKVNKSATDKSKMIGTFSSCCHGASIELCSHATAAATTTSSSSKDPEEEGGTEN